MTNTIRPARLEDAAPLSALAERTFRDTFEHLNTAADIAAYCASAFSPEIQLNELRDPRNDTVVVERGGTLIAYAQLTRSSPPSCVTGDAPIELKRFYVQQAFHGAGLAGVLMDAIVRCAVEHGADVVWLGVWDRNVRARRFYEKCAFREVGEHVFVLGADPQRDLVMTKRIGHDCRTSNAMTTADRVRHHIYTQVAATTHLPQPSEIASALQLPEAEVRGIVKDLAGARMLILAPNDGHIWAAPPFCATPTNFRVECGGRAYWALCIWDALGIRAALGRDGVVHTTCGDCGDPMTGETGVVHFGVPARHFWDNVAFT